MARRQLCAIVPTAGPPAAADSAGQSRTDHQDGDDDRARRAAQPTRRLAGPGRLPLADEVLGGPARQLGAAAEAGLAADLGELALHRARRDEQQLGDLDVRVALGDEVEDLELIAAERAGRARRRAG